MLPKGKKLFFCLFSDEETQLKVDFVDGKWSICADGKLFCLFVSESRILNIQYNCIVLPNTSKQ